MTETTHAAPMTTPAADPIDALLQLIARADRLEALPRTGWLICGISAPETVAAHSYMVAMIAMWIADHLDEPVDMALLLRMALLHDLGESMLTDLPSPVKRFVGAEALAAAEARAVDHVLGDAPPAWSEAVHEYEARASLESRVVKSADRIQMLAKALIYERQQRGDTARFWRVERNFVDEGIPLVREILDRLRAMHDRGEWFISSFD